MSLGEVSDYLFEKILDLEWELKNAETQEEVERIKAEIEEVGKKLSELSDEEG